MLAGKSATTDGSTMITYAADSYMLYGALYHYPARTYPPGSMLDIYEWDTGEYLGKIKQVEKTYAVIGNMNEHRFPLQKVRSEEGRTADTGILDYGI